MSMCLKIINLSIRSCKQTFPIPLGKSGHLLFELYLEEVDFMPLLYIIMLFVNTFSLL